MQDAISDREDSDLLLTYASKFCEASFAELHARYQPALIAYLWRAYRLSQDDAEDVLQEVWIAVAAQCRQSIDCFGSWVYVVADNQAGKYFRRHGTRPDAQLSDDNEPVSHDVSPLDEIIYTEDKATASARLADLDKIDRSALLCVYSDGKTLEQTAEHLGLSTTTVHRRIKRAKESLKLRSA